MEAKTRVKRHNQEKENATSNARNIIDARKNSKTIIPKLKSDSKLLEPKCTRGVTKRPALGSIANNAPSISNKNGKARLIKKIEASKALIGLKSKKHRPVNSENVQNKETDPEPMQVEINDHKPIFKVPEKTFKLPEGVDNIDAEW